MMFSQSSWRGSWAQRCVISKQNSHIYETFCFLVRDKAFDYLLDLCVHALEFCGAFLALVQAEYSHAGGLIGGTIIPANRSKAKSIYLALRIAQRELSFLIRFTGG